MQDRDIMQLILCVLLLISGFVCLLRMTMRDTQSRAAVPAAALLILYALLSGAFCLIIATFADASLLPSLVLMMGCALAAAAFRRVSRCRNVRGMVVNGLLLAWLVAAGAITFLMREPKDDSNVLLQFDALADMVRLHSAAPVTHFLLNVLLFVPLGVLLPLTGNETRSSWLETLATALFLTAAIESVQLIFQLGLADVEDLLANTLGALLGCLACQRLRQQKTQG